MEQIIYCLWHASLEILSLPTHLLMSGIHSEGVLGALDICLSLNDLSLPAVDTPPPPPPDFYIVPSAHAQAPDVCVHGWMPDY